MIGLTALSIPNLLGGGGGTVGLALTFAVGFALILLVGGPLSWHFYQKRKWYIQCEFKMPRSDGLFIAAEIGKAYYDGKQGVVFVKRKGLKKSALKPFDIKKFLQGEKILTVVQTGINTYVPVLPKSYIEMIDDETGEEAALMQVRVDLSESKAWRSQFEREAKGAYSIESMLLQFLPYAGWGMVIFLNFLGFSILYTRIA